MKTWLQHIALLGFISGTAILTPILAFAADPIFSADSSTYSWGGFHVGADVGYRNMSADTSGTPFVELSDDSFIGGFNAGYDLQFDRAIIGLLGELTFGEQSASATSGGSVWDLSTGPSAAIKGRIGYAFDRVLPYVTAGVAFTDAKTQFTPAGLATQSDDKTLTGWTLGAGVEYGINDNWSVKLDYSYSDFGSETFQYTAPGAPATYDISTHTIKFGTSLRF